MKRLILLITVLLLAVANAAASPTGYVRNVISGAPLDAVYPSRENNLALLPGAVATASSWNPSFGGFPPASAIDGDRIGQNCNLNGNTQPCWANNGGWNDNTYMAWPDWLRVDLPRPYAISRIVVVSFQDEFNVPRIEPYLGYRVGGNYVNDDFTIQVLKPDGTWVTVADVEENLDVIREFTFTPTLATAYRINITAAYADFSRVVEFEAYAK